MNTNTMTNNDRKPGLRRLVIRVSRNSLSFSTLQEGEIIFEPFALKSSISMAANLREALRTIPLLQMSYDRVLVLADSPVLMVPVNLFREDEKGDLFHHTFPDLEQQVVMHSVLPDLNSVAVFSVHKDLRMVIGDAFQHVSYAAAVASVWHHLHQRSYTGQRQKLYGYFHDRRMEVFCFAQNRFKFCNSFAVGNPDDAVYYLLAVWKQLGLVPEHDELYLVGELTDGGALTETLQQFLKRVFVINPSGEFNRAAITQIKDVPYDLVTLYLKGR